MMFQKRSRLAWFAAMMSLSLITAACGGKPVSPSGGNEAGQASATAPVGGTVTIRLKTDWDSLDPHKARTTFASQMILAFYDRLVTRDASGKIAPNLAESWEVTADSATFKIKPGISCADGTALKPSDIAESLKRMGAPETKAPYITLSMGTAGYTVTSDDTARTVTVKTNQPFSDMLLGLAMPWASIVCPAGLKNPDALASQPNGTGPFTLEKSVRGDSYTLAARKDYSWGPSGVKTADPGFPEKVIFRVVGNETTAANLITTNELDIAMVGGQDLQRVAQIPGLFRADGHAFGTNWLLFNQAKDRPTADIAVRTALALAVDAKAFNQASTFGTGVIASSLVTDKVGCFDANTKQLVQPYDVNKAKQLLEQAGWKAGADGKLAKNGKPLTVHVVGYEAQNAGPEYVLEALTKLGATVKLTSKDLNAMVEILFKTGDYDLAIFPYAPSMPTMIGATNYLRGKGAPEGSNAGNVQNEPFNTAVTNAITATPDKRCGFWAEAQQALLKNVDIKPLNAEINTWFGRNVKFDLFSGLVIDISTIRRVK